MENEIASWVRDPNRKCRYMVLHLLHPLSPLRALRRLS